MQDESYDEPLLKLSRNAGPYDHRAGNDDYTQPGNLFRLFDDAQRQKLFSDIAESMEGVPQHMIDNPLDRFAKVGPAYVAGVRLGQDRLYGGSAATAA